MYKKLIMACMAAAAFAAFVLPAVASASPELTHPTGSRLSATGSPTIRGHNVGNWVLTGSIGSVTCTNVTLTGSLTENSGTSVKGDITTATFGGTGAGGQCTSTIGDVTVTTTPGNGVPWCLFANNTMVADEFQVRGNNCTGEARSITFVLDFATGQKCFYNRTASVKGSFTTDGTGDAILSFSEQEWTKEGSEGETFLKPCLSSGKLAGSATLETDAEGTLPLYIS